MLVHLVASGINTVRELGLAAAGGRHPSRSEVERLRRLAEHEVRAGRLVRLSSRRRPGAPGKPEIVYAPA